MKRNQITKADYAAAHAFLREYAKTHFQFDGGMPLEAWRATGHPSALKYWRNRWTSVTKNYGVRQGWYIVVDNASPQARQSHTGMLNLYQSRLCKRPLGIGRQPNTASIYLDEQVSLLRQGHIDAHTLAWRAYSYAFEKMAP